MATTQLLDKRQTRTNADSPADSALKVRSNAAYTEVFLSSNIGGTPVHETNTGTTTGSLSVSNPSGLGETDAFAAASYGVLKARSEAVSNFPWYSPSTTAQAHFNDTLVIDAGGLNGTTGWMNVRYDYAWTLLSSAPSHWNIARASLQINNAGHAFAAIEFYEQERLDSAGAFHEFLTSISGSGDLVDEVQGTYGVLQIPVVFGTNVILDMRLRVDSTASDGFASAEAANSGYWGGATFFDSNMREISATITSESNTNYNQSFAPSAVPEPPAMALVAIGLLAIFAGRSNKPRQRT